MVLKQEVYMNVFGHMKPLEIFVELGSIFKTTLGSKITFGLD